MRKLAYLLVCLLALPAMGQPWSGSGTPNDPYQIWDACDMQAIGANSVYWDAHFELCADINLAEYTGTQFNIIGNDVNAFTGVFDGNGHVISNFTYQITGTNYIGLFRYVDDPNAEIKNLGLVDPNINAGTGRFVGSLVGKLLNGTVTDCYIKGGSVSAKDQVGGLVGYTEQPAGEVSTCYSTCSVSGEDDIGGLVGLNTKKIYNCYSKSSVSGIRNIGGLVGWNYGWGGILNCYSIGSVSGTWEDGGLVGYNEGGSVLNSFWDIETSGQSSSAGGIGKITIEMQDVNTYFGWGCESVWTIDDGNDYPHFFWEGQPGVLITNTNYGGGSGEPNDPYLIYSADQLNTMGLVYCHLDKYFKLVADINLASYTGKAFNIIGDEVIRFRGVFDGNGHTISNFTYECNTIDYIGLFRFVDGWNGVAEIRNLRLLNPDINAPGYEKGGELLGGEYVGALVGRSVYGTITNCYVQGGCVRGRWDVGGLVGSIWRAQILNCYSATDAVGEDSIGGLIGENHPGFVSNCYASGSVSGQGYVGGLIGINEGTIWHGYSTGTVSGLYSVGGLIGVDQGVVKDSFWDVQTSGQISGDGGIGKTTAEMKTAGTFIGWGSCENEGVWTIDEGNDYPRLWWENKPGEPLPVQTLSDFLTGTGTEGDPYLIWTAGELDVIGMFACEWDAHFKLMADIDLGGVNQTECIAGEYLGVYAPHYPFTGVFDGNGHTIRSFKLVSGGDTGVGVFGYLGGGAEVRDLGVENINMNSFTGKRVGGLAGYNSGGIISRCYVTGVTKGYQRTGGLVGQNSLTGIISNCYNSASASCGGSRTGGLVAHNKGVILNCYSTGVVAGAGPKGGLVGDNDGVVDNSFWDVNSSGQATSAGGTGKTTAQMQTESTFTDAGWDFMGEVINGPNDFWDICEGTNYPKFVWQIPVGDFVCPDGITFIDFSVLGQAWLSEPGQLNWDPNCDISEPNDNVIDELDMMVFTDNWLGGL
ncbi:MAG: GLUG motif-containing protein [Planctomycetota bacterium]|jgi:hypothetical protein